MKYLTEERFIVHSSDPGAQKRYAEGWERTFGEKSDGGEYGDGSSGDVPENTFKVSQPPRVEGCQSSECEIRNLCTGSAHCPYIRDADYKIVGVGVLLPGHIDNTGMLCRNSSKRVPISHLDHDACYTCNEFMTAALTPRSMYED